MSVEGTFTFSDYHIGRKLHVKIKLETIDYLIYLAIAIAPNKSMI